MLFTAPVPDRRGGAVGVLLSASFVGTWEHGAFLLKFENIEIFKFLITILFSNHLMNIRISTVIMFNEQK